MSKNLQSKTKQPLIIQYLDRYKDQIAAALPKHMTPERMARIVTTEVRKIPKLLACDPKSLFGAVIQSSQLGLEPGSALGHCHLIPFGKEVQLIIGYRGMIDLARRSGQILSIEARAVHSGDEFTYNFGLNPDLKHIPCIEPGDLTHAYAVAKLVGGGVQFDVMDRLQIEMIRSKSKAGKSGPWVDHFTEMSKKTVVRRLFKYLPVSIEMQTAVGLDEQADAGVAQQSGALIEGEFLDLGPEAELENEPKTQTAKVTKKLGGKKTTEKKGKDAPPNVDKEDPGIGGGVDVFTVIDNIKFSEDVVLAREFIDKMPTGAERDKATTKLLVKCDARGISLE